MGYVASRKFCCCLPVRFGVFCMALLGLAAGAAIAAFGWIEVHNQMTHKLDLDTREQVALWFISVVWSFSALIALIGLIGSIFKVRGLITTYAYTVTIHTLVSITLGIFFIWTLFHRDSGAVEKCINGDDGEIKSWVCRKGFQVIRILIIIAFVIIWIFQIVGIFIVFDYVGQLHEEHEMEEDEEDKKAQRKQRQDPPPPIVVAAPPMRTTYDASPYPMEQGGWTSAKSPYAFNLPQNAHGGR